MFILFVAVLMLCGCAGDASTSDEDAMTRFVEDMPNQLSLEDLNDRSVEFSEDEYSDQISLQGKFVDFTVWDSDDAFRAAASVADVLNISDFKEDIRFYTSREGKYHDMYYFSQYYKGIPVIGSRIVLTVDPESKCVESLVSGYVTGISVGTEPAISAEDAAASVREKYHIDVTEDSRLVIDLYASDSKPHLAWLVDTDSDAPNMVSIDAISGEELNSEYPDDYFGL